MQADNYRKATKSLLQIEKQDHRYIQEALPLLLDCYLQMDNLKVFNSWLQSLLTQYPNMTSVRLMLTHVIQLQHGSQAAQDYLYPQLREHPSVEGLHRLISLGKQSNPMLVPLIKGITDTLVRISVGLEAAEDIIADLEYGLAASAEHAAKQLSAAG
jgi:hypothetical protein